MDFELVMRAALELVLWLGWLGMVLTLAGVAVVLGWSLVKDWCK